MKRSETKDLIRQCENIERLRWRKCLVAFFTGGLLMYEALRQANGAGRARLMHDLLRDNPDNFIDDED